MPPGTRSVHRYWPALYWVDAAGHIRYAHVGEGGYRRTEANIVALLAEADRASKPAEPNPQPLRKGEVGSEEPPAR